MVTLLHTHNETETRELARRLASVTPPGGRVLLDGDLGAGKTTFTQGFVGGLTQLEVVRVKSPTYALCHAYKTSPRVWHADLYRLHGPDDVEMLGVFASVTAEDILIVEWADRAPGLITDALHVLLEMDGEEGRRITLSASGPISTSMLEKLGQ